MKSSKQSSRRARRSLLTFFSGLLIVVLFGIAVATPLIVALNSVSNKTVSTTTSITTTAITTNATGTTSITSAATTASSTTTIASIQWNSTGSTVAGQLGMTGATATYLNLPIGIWVDTSNNLYVADASNNRIQRFALGNTTGTTVAGSSSGVGGSSASSLNYTNDMRVDSSGNIYVVDSYNNRVQLWNASASVGITIAGNGTAGNSTTSLSSPRHIVFGSNTNTYYVSDSSNNRVMQYTLNSNVGTVVAGGNGAGTSTTQLNNPRGLYFDSSTNSLLIANPGANNVVRWVIGASSWTLVAGNLNGSAGSGSTGLNNPWDVTSDSSGNIYVADRYNYRIQFFAANQTNGTTIAGVTGVSGNNATTLDQPLSLALDNQLNLIVSDSFNNRIQKFVRY